MSFNESKLSPRQPAPEKSFKIEPKMVDAEPTEFEDTKIAPRSKRLRPKTVPRKNLIIGNEPGDIITELKMLDSSGSYESI